MFLATHGVIRNNSGGGYTARTTAFATATAITDTTILNALNTFDLGLISNGLDTKMKAIYPFVGSTATTQKFNFMDARDLDVAFRLNFSGGITHSSTGALFGGVNGYADTKLIPSTNFTFGSTHISIYSRTNAQKDAWNGASNSFLPIFALNLRATDDIISFDGYDYSAHRISALSTDSRGFFIGNVSSTTSQKIYKNGSSIVSNTTAQTQTTLPSNSMFLAGRNDSGSTSSYDNKEIALATIGIGLTDTDASNLYTLVQAFQTSLSRQV